MENTLIEMLGAFNIRDIEADVARSHGGVGSWLDTQWELLLNGMNYNH